MKLFYLAHYHFHSSSVACIEILLMKKKQIIISTLIKYLVSDDIIDIVTNYLIPEFDCTCYNTNNRDILMATSNNNLSYPDIKLTNGLIVSYNKHGYICMWNPMTVKSISITKISDICCTRKYNPKIHIINTDMMAYCYYSLHSKMTLLILCTNNCSLLHKIPLRVKRRKTVFDVKETQYDGQNVLEIAFKSRSRHYDLSSWSWIRTIASYHSPKIVQPIIHQYDLLSSGFIDTINQVILPNGNIIFPHQSVVDGIWVTNLYLVLPNSQIAQPMVTNLRGNFNCFCLIDYKYLIISLCNHVLIIDCENRCCVQQIDFHTQKILIDDNNFFLFSYQEILKCYRLL